MKNKEYETESESGATFPTSRTKIVAAATELFYRNGIRATGIDAVIEAADVARMTLYKYFPSKEALVDAVLTESADRIWASLAPIIDDESFSPKERILAVFDWQTTRTSLDSYRGCPFFNAVVENPDHDSSSFAVALKSKLQLHNAIEGLTSRLGIADNTLLAEQINLLFDGAATHAQMGLADKAAKAARAAVEQLIDAATKQQSVAADQ